MPWAINRMVTYMDQRYGRPEIWVLENGVSEKGEAYKSGPSALQDPFRTRYFQGYIDEACKAKKAGVRLSHYYVWSLMDNVRVLLTCGGFFWGRAGLGGDGCAFAAGL